MTTKQTIAKLQPLRSDVSQAKRRLHDNLATGMQRPTIDGYLDTWREAVRTYLDMLADATVDERALNKLIASHTKRLQKGFDLPYPESTVDAWRHDKHFEKLLYELEVAYDLRAGYDTARGWLLAQDARLRQTIQKSEKNRWQLDVNAEPTEQPQEVH